MPLGAFAHSQLLSELLVLRGLPTNVLNNTSLSTYETAGGGASLDSWQAGTTLFKNMLIVVDVGVATGTGGLVVSLYDSPIALTNSNGAANQHKVLDLAAITAVGLYIAEITFSHVFPSTYTRVVAHPTVAHSIMRYLSITSTATTHSYTHSILVIMGGNLRQFPTQVATTLAATYVSS
jgi:hypothetical protein